MLKKLLFNHLEELLEEQFKRFRWSLTNQKDGKAIPKSHLENADRMDTVSKMVENYREEGALEVTVSILKAQRMNDLAEKLQNAYRGDYEILYSP
uniref:Pyrin domain-containing protein n=1 Tax=Fundulus heteroclitus TaxID=8078 RepID=A0A3Q2TNU4_FUNHE